ncbi:hypothetical protein [Streptomyces sp. NPDC058664]|uniref:hypothetical protein n=1 Tax=unclassified Streptomyces TaxID=2593676 RepID=UPI00364A932B
MTESDPAGEKSRARRGPAGPGLRRDFTAQVPGTRLVGDITYIPTGEGWLYLATWAGVLSVVVGVHNRVGEAGTGPFSGGQGIGEGLGAQVMRDRPAARRCEARLMMVVR